MKILMQSWRSVFELPPPRASVLQRIPFESMNDEGYASLAHKSLSLQRIPFESMNGGSSVARSLGGGQCCCINTEVQYGCINNEVQYGYINTEVQCCCINTEVQYGCIRAWSLGGGQASEQYQGLGRVSSPYFGPARAVQVRRRWLKGVHGSGGSALVHLGCTV